MNNNDLPLCVLTFADVFGFMKVFGSVVEVRSYSACDPSTVDYILFHTETFSAEAQTDSNKKAGPSKGWKGK